jgi:chromosome segregation ATPase
MEPTDKAHYVKEIAKLRGEIKSLQADERWDQLLRVKEENEQVTNELEKARERIRMNERRERELTMQLKEVKEELDRTKSKYLQSESFKNEGEVVIAERDRTIK